MRTDRVVVAHAAGSMGALFMTPFPPPGNRPGPRSDETLNVEGGKHVL